MESTAKSRDTPTRRTRVRAQIPLRVTSLDPATELSESCHTLVVNPHGCGVRLPCPLEPGMPVRLDDLPGGNEATARVANCVPLGTENKYWLVGLALDHSGNVWCRASHQEERMALFAILHPRGVPSRPKVDCGSGC
jgi:hypothetical protein